MDSVRIWGIMAYTGAGAQAVIAEDGSLPMGETPDYTSVVDDQCFSFMLSINFHRGLMLYHFSFLLSQAQRNVFEFSAIVSVGMSLINL